MNRVHRRGRTAIRRSLSSSGERWSRCVVFATSETDKDCVSRAGEMRVSHAREAVVGNIECHTKKPERWLSPTLTSTPEATCPVIWIGCKGPTTTAPHPCLSPPLPNGIPLRSRLGPRQRNGVILPLGPSRICDVPRPPSQKSFKHSAVKR